MNKVRLSASVDADLVAAAEAAVARGRLQSVSAWVNEALRAKLEHERRLDALGAFIAEYEKEAKSKSPLSDFAKETLPTLEHHLQTAETLAKEK